MSKTIFEKIIDKEIPSDIIYEDDLLIAIKDINPVAPVHLLIIPKKVIPTLNDLSKEDSIIVGKMVSLAKDLAKKLDIDKTGYRTVFNCNDHGDKLFIIYIST
ncbi:MAG: histidine triad nucleotide-binding protein [Candidatus Neomarinimicrobiota bacterium]|nr:MAG: histidine triad nucleotide-binding protein [Candidatus Neomarinimicrobiota bacterium]